MNAHRARCGALALKTEYEVCDKGKPKEKWGRKATGPSS
jgi:hypothetical protein